MTGCQQTGGRLSWTRGGAVVNRTIFGKRLAQIARRELSWYLPEAGYGFLDGGCLDFAIALRNWSRGRFTLTALRRAGSNADDHAMATTMDGRLHLDADGLGTTVDVQQRWLAFEHLQMRCATLTYPPESNLVWDRARAERLTESIFEGMGSPTLWQNNWTQHQSRQGGQNGKNGQCDGDGAASCADRLIQHG